VFQPFFLLEAAPPFLSYLSFSFSLLLHFSLNMGMKAVAMTARFFNSSQLDALLNPTPEVLFILFSFYLLFSDRKEAVTFRLSLVSRCPLSIAGLL